MGKTLSPSPPGTPTGESEPQSTGKITEAGDGSNKPRPNDTVTVSYSGYLYENGRGECFDSSEERGDLTFQLGTKTVITGFQAAVLSMTIEERRTVIIPPENAYGSRYGSFLAGNYPSTDVLTSGFPGLIPPDSTLEL
ncbi:hypothetical protein DIZ76_014272 [Coccidioides immitis]|nr:hypothetical protein DIZ76_014272 [Coccidioides immitis]